MLLKELLPEINGDISNTEITGLTCNSSSVKAGNAFVCISGSKFDGHNFAESAVKNGAAVVICQKDTGLKNQIIVDDTRAAFSQMSAKWFGEPAKKLKLIGITGTNGKTSVSYMIKHILEYAGYKTGLIGTIQNMIGETVYKTNHTTPDAYELNEIFDKMYTAGCDYVIMEVSSHALDQKRVYGVEFEVGIFTNLTQDHLDYHITMENYAKAKSLMFSMCKNALINEDDEYCRYMQLNCKNYKSYSANGKTSDFYADNIVLKSDSISYNICGEFNEKINLSIGGKFSVYNSLCAVATAYLLGIPQKLIKESLNSMHGVKGRAETVENPFGFTVIIDYAHTPDGLKSILSAFSECKKNKLTVLFGCGGDRDKTKRPLMGSIAEKSADKLIVTSDNPRSEEPMDIITDIMGGIEQKDKVTVIENRAEAIRYAILNAEKDDIIVLAGKGHETYQVLKDKTIHFDEREVVKEVLKERAGE